MPAGRRRCLDDRTCPGFGSYRRGWAFRSGSLSMRVLDLDGREVHSKVKG